MPLLMGFGTKLFWFTGLIAALGLVLLARGVRPRRRGETLYCGRCGYNLTGLELLTAGAQCPECGTVLARARAIVVGERRVRWGRAAAGAVLLLAAGLTMTAGSAGASWGWRWQRHAPYSFLMRSVEERGDWAEGALGELRLRAATHQLSTAQLGRLAEACLAEQREPSELKFFYDMALDTLVEFNEAGQLSPEQQDRFFRQMVKLSLRVRPRVSAGIPFKVDTLIEPRGPYDGFWARLQCTTVADPGAIALGEPSTYEFGAGSWCPGAPGQLVRIDSPGEYTLSQQCRVQISSRRTEPVRRSGGDEGWELYATDLVISAPVEVLPQGVLEVVRLAHSPQLDESVVRGTRIASVDAYLVERAPPGAGGAATLSLTIESSAPLLANLAFDVLLVAGADEFALGTATLAAGNGGTVVHGLWATLLGDLPNKFAIVLRSSTSAALHSTTFEQIWDGELRFEDFTWDAAGEEILPHEHNSPVLVRPPASAPADGKGSDAAP